MESSRHRRWRLAPILWLPLMTFIGLIFIVDVFQIPYTINLTKVAVLQEDKYNIPELNSDKSFLIKTKGCRIQYMNPFDPSIVKYIFLEQPPVCNDHIPPLIEDNSDTISIIDESIPYYAPNPSFECCYRAIYRKEPVNDEVDNKVIIGNYCIPFQETAKINEEFIEVICTYQNKTIYRDFFAFVPTKRISEEVQDKFKRDNDKFNILIIGIDAVSRVNFHRQMPKTVKYLLKNLSAIELLGYNKVADNTFPNLIPVLAGQKEQEFESCWNVSKRFDNCSFVWKNFSSEGYVTAYGEDSAWMGTFNYLKRGFFKQPTDYMWGAFDRYTESQIGNAHRFNVDQCIGSREVYRVFLDYIKKFVRRMDLEWLRYFAFFWGSSLTHDFLNKPKLGDGAYTKLLKILNEEGHLKDTILIVMSDHGIRWGPIRETYMGRMEERLPFVFFVLPERFKKRYTQAHVNLLKNTRRLTTPFDLHETLVDLLDPTKISYTISEKRRGYSLFTEITSERTCEDAEISTHWCACLNSDPVNVNEPIVKAAGQFAVDSMNHYLEGYSDCAVLKLAQIKGANLMTHGKHISINEFTRDYLLTITTTPGDGVFEVTVRVTGNSETYHFAIMGTISRLNLYGKQSSCITEFHLKLYCYCKIYL